MKTFTAVAVVIALLATAPAYAQFSMGGGGEKRARGGMTDEEKRADDEAEKAYRNTIRNTRSSTPAVAKDDPWASVRPTAPAKPTR